jgi:hypothetical protein
MFANLNGYFSMKNVRIEKTYSVSSVIAEIFDVAYMNSISGSIITNNHFLIYEEIERELITPSQCSLLCHLRLNKTILLNQIASIYKKELTPNKFLIVVLSSSIYLYQTIV